MRWYWSKDKFIKDKNEVIIKKVENTYSLYKKQRPALGDLPSKRGKTTFYHKKYSNTYSNSTIKSLLNEKVFQYSKSIKLLEDIIRLANTKSDDIILDFFAGSGTTAHAVMQLNAEDDGNRKCISVQWDEKIDSKKSSTAYDFCEENNFQPIHFIYYNRAN